MKFLSTQTETGLNPRKHALLSVRRWGGLETDYLPIHNFIDHTKSLCPDMRHRILHTLWGISHIVVPIFGDTITNSDGKRVDVKDLCERDHLLADYGNRFIPTLSDFTAAIDDEWLLVHQADFKQKLEQFHQKHISRPEISELMLSPLSHTGKVKSLLFTHNSWFINTILPKMFGCKPVIDDISLSPSDFIHAMRFEMWMDNGMAFPDSAKMLEKRLLKRQ